MDRIQYYPRIKEATWRHPSVKNTYHTLISICNGTKRHSGRLVIDHYLRTADIVAGYLIDPVSIIGAMLHDISEDYNFGVADVKAVPSSYRTGECAQIVSILSKSGDIKDKWIRDQIYMKQLWRSIIIKRQKGIGIIKLADRLDNLSDVEYLPPDRMAFILWQSIFFYVPLAIKLNLPALSKKILCAAIQHLPNKQKEI
jgi:GTP diphosphokinase / guanosine-3',5'-bis(diphosphate) 3'-diphosphatase